MIRLLIYTIGLIASITCLVVVDSNSIAFVIFGGLVAGFVIPLLDSLVSNYSYLRIAVYALRTWRTRVRISASYLYRIYVDNEYLLVKGKRFEQYQPVGGVYKAHPSSAEARRKLGILDDKLLLPDEVSESDLRIRVPGKNLVAFVRWFETGHGRETDGWREFHEELIATGILPGASFQHIKYDQIERIYRPLRFSRWAESHELLIADILEILPTPEQLEALRTLKSKKDERFIWAQENRIRRLGASDGAASQPIRIAETARWVIDAQE